MTLIGTFSRSSAMKLLWEVFGNLSTNKYTEKILCTDTLLFLVVSNSLHFRVKSKNLLVRSCRNLTEINLMVKARGGWKLVTFDRNLFPIQALTFECTGLPVWFWRVYIFTTSKSQWSLKFIEPRSRSRQSDRFFEFLFSECKFLVMSSTYLDVVRLILVHDAQRVRELYSALLTRSN